MKINKNLTSQLGRNADQPGKGSDFAFYDWLQGTDKQPTLPKIFLWLLDDLKEENDPAEVKKVLDLWQQSTDINEFKNRMALLEKIMPPHHPFHNLKNEYK